MVEREMSGENLGGLWPAARLRRFHQLAQDAREEAQKTQGKARASYLHIAEQWDLLAMIMGRYIKRDGNDDGAA